MELSFIFAALRRYFPVIQITAIIGMVIGILVAGSNVDTYTARASVLIQPPASAFVQSSTAAEERFFEGELLRLASNDLSELVADDVNEQGQYRVDADLVGDALGVIQAEITDVIVIEATTETPGLSQAIANSYVTQLLADQERRANNRNLPEISKIDERILEIDDTLDEFNEDLSQLPEIPVTSTQRSLQLQLLRRIGQLEDERAGLLATRNELDLTSDLEVLSEVIDFADAPLFPDGQSATLLAIAGAFVGGCLGLALAVTLAGSSKKVLDATQLEELLGTNVAVRFPRDRSLRDKAAAFRGIPDGVSAAVDGLCVQAESIGLDRATIRIAVASTLPGGGATTTALAMARRFSLQSSSVVLVDANTHDEDLAELVGAPGHPGLVELLDAMRASGGAEVDLSPYFAPTDNPRVDVLGMGAGTPGEAVLARTNVDALFEAMSATTAEIVIFDAGQLQSSAATVRLAELADVVVLTIPIKRQRVEPLALMRRLLADSRGVVLPVVTQPRRRGKRA